jgi:hypothetical protein
MEWEMGAFYTLSSGLDHMKVRKEQRRITPHRHDGFPQWLARGEPDVTFVRNNTVVAL